jgi:UDP-glucose 4-epimerase
MAKLFVVTGGAGFVGSHLCERLRDEGHRVISLDNYFAGSTENHIDGVEYREGHTKDIATLVPETPDVLFHLGEYARVEQSFNAIPTVIDFNIIGTAAVLEYWREKGCKLVYAGSSTKFAENGQGKDQSPYAWTKATNTELVKRYGAWFGLEYAITYFYNVYGPRERGDIETGTLIGIFRDKVRRGEPLTVRLPGTQRRNFTHVFDIVDGIVRVGYNGTGDEFGLGNPQSFSILEVAELFGGEIHHLEERPGNRQNSEVDIRRAMEELGWQPKYTLTEYILRLKSE